MELAVTSTDWGRVDGDGTVYVKTADGERPVGQMPDATPEEAMAFYARRYDALALEVRLHSQLRRERLSQPVVLTEGLGAAPCNRVRSHQRAMGPLVDGLGLERPAQHLHGRIRLGPALEQLGQLHGNGDELGPELFAWKHRPLLVGILRQEVSSIELHRRSVGVEGARASRLRGGGAQLLDVHTRSRHEREEAVATLDELPPAGGVERSPGRVHCLPELVRRGRGVQIRPEDVHQPLAVESVPGRQGQELHEGARLPEAPRFLIDLPAGDLHAELAEQADAERGRRFGCWLLRHSSYASVPPPVGSVQNRVGPRMRPGW